MKTIIKKILPISVWLSLSKFKESTLNGYKISSYSQEGEDMILRRLLENKHQGFYVDVGAHHPRRFSNTYYFYQCGWRGINIDAMPNSMSAFARTRPRDINIEAAISDNSANLTFHIYEESALNTLDTKVVYSHQLAGRIAREKRIIETQPLSKILDHYLPQKQTIDFLTVDVEGFDLSVLRSNNWDKYRPQFVVVECHNTTIHSIQAHETYQFLSQYGYELVAKTLCTGIFGLR